MRRNGCSRALVAALVIPVAALGGIGCGDDGTPARTGGKAQDPHPTTAGSGPTPDKGGTDRRDRSRTATDVPSESARAESAVTRVYGALGDGRRVDGAALCRLMTARAREQTVTYARNVAGLGGSWTCPRAVTVLARRTAKRGGLERLQKAHVVGVNVDGDRATATVRFGRGAGTGIALVKESGQWKLASTPSR